MAKSLRKPPPPRKKYPFDELEIGDGFFLKDRTKNNLSNQASTIGKNLGKKFKTMLTYMTHSATNEDPQGQQWKRCTKDEHGAVLGIGVWRMK
jgi:hypothetical protein